MDTRLDELFNTWVYCRREWWAGRTDSITAVREELILKKQARDEGLDDELRERIKDFNIKGRWGHRTEGRLVNN